MILLLDNYDSFTHNLAHLIQGAVPGERVHIVRNDTSTVGELLALNPRALVLSPGPGRPEQAGVLQDLITAWSSQRPLLGVCLGHQALGLHFGARLVRIPPHHGKTSGIAHVDSGAFQGLPQGFEAMRYHSLALAPESLRAPLRATAWVTEEPHPIMGVAVDGRPWEGVQFHPESYRSEEGLTLLRRFFGAADGSPSPSRL